MLSAETATWIGVGLVAVAYIANRHAQIAKAQLPKPPSAQQEVDPTRWRHDGRQEIAYRDGNKAINKTFDETNSLFETIGF